MKPGDLVKIYNDSNKNIIFWYKTINNDVNPNMVPGPVIAMYLGTWKDPCRNPLNVWREVLINEKIYLAHVKKIRKIKL